MSLLDLILNLTALLLWISWRTLPFDPWAKGRPATLTGTLRRAEPGQSKAWHLLAALVGLLIARALFYWWIGAALDWTPGIKLGAITVSFRSGMFWRMVLFSFASFADLLLVFFLWLILFSLATPTTAEPDSCQRFIRVQLRPVYSWRWYAKASLPLILAMTLWLLTGPLLSQMKIIPPVQSWLHRFEQATVLGLGVYTVWKYGIMAVLALHLLNSYVYLGNHPVWGFINNTASAFLAPLRRLPLRAGKVDFSPLVGIGLVCALAELAERGLKYLYERLPL
jgi:uncharacterized protein YggT (Ycf19 family)